MSATPQDKARAAFDKARKATKAAGKDAGNGAALIVPSMSLAQISAAEQASPDWLYDKLLPVGAFLIVGRPKIGKSWLLLQFALCAGVGADFLDFEASGVCAGLYIAAEDTDERIQRRLRAIGVQAPSNVEVLTQPAFLALATTYSASMTLLEFLDRYLQEHPHVRFVLLDTEETCRATWDGERAANDNRRITTQDYAQTRGFDELGLRRKVLIGLVNHTRKNANGKAAGDPHEQINRTNVALAGASGSLVLSNHPDADPLDVSERRRLLAVRGRDLDDDVMLLLEHSKGGTFKNLGQYFQVRQAEVEQQVLEAVADLQDGDQWTSTSDVAEHTGMSKGAVKSALHRMRKGNRIVWNGQRVETKKGKGGGVRLVPVVQ